MHETEPIAGLRSSGKGANRTILDCLFRPFGRDKRVLLPPRGSRAPAATLGRQGASVARSRHRGRFRLQMRKGLES